MKTCRVCKEIKADSAFYARRTNRDGLRTECKKCHGAFGRCNYLQNKDRIDYTNLRGHLRRSYGLQVKDWDALFARQGGVCAICGQPETRYNNKSKKTQKLCVDHNHRTDAVRGLLCHRCNSTIGLVEESTYRLQQMIEYLNSQTEGI